MTKFLILIKECCKDAQEYIPDYLDDIVEKLVDCVFSLKTPTNKNPLFKAFVDSAGEAGYKINNDMNGKEQEGFGMYDVTIHKGERASVSK